MGAECAGQGTGGNKCEVLLSPCLLIAIPLQNTLGEPSALAGVLQWVTSLSPILVTDGIPVSLAPVICR